jgi:DNA-binding transcriptional LysR family regulator
VNLIERVGKKAMPTPAGLRLLDHARRITRDVSEATSDMEAFTQDSFGRVRIGTGATACIYFLPSVLKELRLRFPKLEITVATGNTSDILKLIDENMIDLGFVTLPAPGRMFDVNPVIQDPFVLVCAPEFHPLPSRAKPADVAKLPLISFETGGNMQRVVDHWFKAAGVTPASNMVLGNVEAIKELVGAGLGYAILPLSAFQDVHQTKLLATHPLEPRLIREIAIVVRQDKPLNRGLRETMRCLMALGHTGSSKRDRP